MMPFSLEELPDKVRELVGKTRNLEVPEQGDTSDVILLRGSRGDFVVKRATRPPFDEWLRRESEVLAALKDSGLPMPELHLFLETGVGELSPGRAAWLVMERLPGIPLRTRLRSEEDPRVRRRLLTAFGEIVRAIHTTRLPEPLPGILAVDKPWLESALECARRYLERYEVDGTPELLERLTSNPPRQVPQTLIHGDCTMSNVLVVGERVSGVIDWCWGAFGDPRYDLALATDAKPEAFQEAADLDAFYEGYGAPRLSPEEAEYFLGLYEFF